MKFTSFDGKQIEVYEWTTENPVGVVQIVHGMVEHATRYEEFAQFLNRNGFVVVADDHRGHGLTDENTLGYCKGNMFEDTVKDEAEITRYFKKKYEGLKYFVFGFSYGSFLTQSYISKYGDMIDGAVIGGGNHKKDFEVYFGRLVAKLACLFVGEKKPNNFICNLSFGGYSKQFEDGEWLSIDAENNAKYHADPFCSFVCSNRFYADFFGGMISLYTKEYEEGLRKDLPVLLASGANDPVGDQGKGVQRLYDYLTQKAGMQNVQMKLFEGSRHEFLNEKENRMEKWGTILDFFESIAK